MERLIANQKKAEVGKIFNTEAVLLNVNNRQAGSAEKYMVRMLIKIRLFYFAFTIIKNPAKVFKVFKSLIKMRDLVQGGPLKKMYKVAGKYYVAQYRPGWPSKIYDDFIKSELRRMANPQQIESRLTFIFFAITRKCPLRCEHCFEWDNLNQKESFTKDDLFKVVDLYQKTGVSQFHFSGGEPMVRLKDLLSLIAHASKKSECWVLTSGFNCTAENIKLLKQAGCTGIVVSMDHYIAELHNLFRGNDASFEHAVNAVAAAKQEGLVVSLSVCATKAFIDGGHLMPYMDFAKSMGVQFVQVLEPKSVGHYEGKNVLLEEKHIVALEQIFTSINHSLEYKDYPTIMYHGYHQRRIGCFSGSRSIYIDSAGDVNACPFCHTKSYNIIQLVRNKKNELPAKGNTCPDYEKVV
ncbi:MAG: radical SAM protein [Ferruginibacter sp.]